MPKTNTESAEAPPRTSHCAALLSALARSSDHLFAFDRIGRFLYVSPAAAAALGLSAEDMLGRRWSELGLPAEVMERFDRLRESVLESGRPVKARTLYPGRERLHDFELWLLPISGDDGRPETVVCVARRLGVQAAPTPADDAQSHWWPREPLPMLVCYVDAERCYRYNSAAYSEWFGWSPEQILGRPLWEVLGESAYARVRPYVDAALVGVPVHFEQVVPYREAGTRTVRAHYLPDPGPDGRVRGFFALIRDLTEEAEPAGQVPAGTGARQDMLGSRERLATIGEMATEILHEMSQPLTSIGLFSETGVRLLAAGAEGARPALEVLEEIRSQSERARGMMERLRRFVRSGRASEAPVEINHLIRTVVRLTAPETEVRGAVLELRLRSGLCIVSAERVLLEHLMLYLIRNALAALDGLPPGQRRLVLRTTRTGRRVRVTVADSRPVSPGMRHREPFDPRGGVPPEPGALALALGQAIAKAHGGGLRVRQLPGLGAVVQLTLPAACEE